MATKQSASRAAGLKADYGTLRETFFEQQTQSIGLQGSMLDISDENRRAIDAMHRKTQSDSLIHKSRMAQMGLDFRKQQWADELANRTVRNTFGLMDQMISEERNRDQLDELRNAMGLNPLDTNMKREIPGLVEGGLQSNFSQSTYGLPETGGVV